MGEKNTVAMTRGVSEDYGINMVLHLDHCTDFDMIKRCVDQGFTSVMIDASKETFEKNVEVTSKVVEYASKYGVTVEAELGHVGGKEDDIVVADDSIFFTVPEEAVKFVKATGIDCLAVAVGTVHGFYKSTPKLDFPRISKIHELLPDTPLVLHGGTGVPDDDFRNAIARGVRKINVGTEFRVHGIYDVSKKGYAENQGDDPRAISKLVIAKCAAIAKEKIEVMGSVGKA